MLRNHPTIPVLIISIALGMLSALVFPRFDGLYGQDPFAYYGYATGPLRESLLNIKPIPSFFWPPGYPLVLALASLLFEPSPRLAQVISLLSGITVPIFTSLLAMAIWPEEGLGRTLAITAGLLGAFTGQLWQSSVVIMADTFALACVTLGVWAIARYGGPHAIGSSRRTHWLAIAAGMLSYAVLTRWAYALVAIPVTIYALLSLWRQPKAQAMWQTGVAGIITLVILIPVLSPVAAHVQGSVGENQPFIGDLRVYSWNPLNAARREFYTADGRLSYRFPNGAYYALAPAHRFYFTPLLAPLILPGIWHALRRRNWASSLLVIGWAAAIYTFHAGAPWQNFRFTLAYLPPVAVLAALGWTSILNAKPRHRHWLLWVIFASGVTWMAYGGWRLTSGFIDRKEEDLGTVHWVQSHTPSNARVIAFGLTATLQYYSTLETHELFFLDPDGLEDLLADNQSTFLLLNIQNINTQWVGRPPEINYRWLRAEHRLSDIGTHLEYTLFEVGSEP